MRQLVFDAWQLFQISNVAEAKKHAPTKVKKPSCIVCICIDIFVNDEGYSLPPES